MNGSLRQTQAADRPSERVHGYQSSTSTSTAPPPRRPEPGFEGTSFPTPCANYCNETGYAGFNWGKDAVGVYDWLTKSHVIIRINTSKKWTYASYEAMVVHELGHAIGLTHTDRCDSVMSETCHGKKVPMAYDTAEVERISPR